MTAKTGLGIGMVALLAILTVYAGDSSIVFEESFSGYETGAKMEQPWRTSGGDDGITVAVGNPSGAAEGEHWLHLADPVSEPSRACANIRRVLPPMSYGELTFRLHIKSLARFATYLGKGAASSPEDRVVGFKMHGNGRFFIANDLLDQRPAWALEAGATYTIRLTFEPRDEEYTSVTLHVDDGKTPHTLEAVVPKGDPITALRITTENRDAGGDFFLTDLVLTRRNG